MERKYTIFAGVNGAGKSTLYETLVSDGLRKLPRVNSDEIIQRKHGNWNDPMDQILAAKDAIDLIRQFIENGISFNHETTLAGPSLIPYIQLAKEQGFVVEMYYVGLKNADLAIDRVQKRVKLGGHGLSDKHIRSRYTQSLRMLKKIIPLCDSVKIYDNTENLNIVASIENGITKFRQPCDWLSTYLDNPENQYGSDPLQNKETQTIGSWEKQLNHPLLHNINDPSDSKNTTLQGKKSAEKNA